MRGGWEAEHIPAWCSVGFRPSTLLPSRILLSVNGDGLRWGAHQLWAGWVGLGQEDPQAALFLHPGHCANAVQFTACPVKHQSFISPHSRGGATLFPFHGGKTGPARVTDLPKVTPGWGWACPHDSAFWVDGAWTLML